jgi:putative oxidoreductase
MILFDKISNWSVAHNPKWLAFLRVALGLCLLSKGLSFLYHSISFHDLVVSSTSINQPWIDNAVIWINIIGGFFIVIGFGTRLASLIQIPIMLGAIFFVNGSAGIFSFQNSMIFSILILVLLIIFFVEGDGPISMANYVKTDD